jgi:hypothetical protein
VLGTRRLLLVLLVSLVLAACGGGETEVTGGGGDDTGATGPTATGASGATATGATGAATGSTGAVGGGAYSLALEDYPREVTDVAFYTCDGLEGTWIYLFQAEFAPGVAFDIDEEVDMGGGDGTLVISGAFELAGLGTVSWTDTIDLRLNGSRSLEATDIRVEVDAPIPGFSDDLFTGLIPEGRPIPIVEGSDRC